MASRKTLLIVLGALGAGTVACLNNSPSPPPGGSSSSGGSGSGGASSSGTASSTGTGSSSGGTASSSGGSSSGGVASEGCSYAVSGGTTGSGACTAVGAYAANNSITAFGLTPGTSSPVFALSVELGTTPAAFQSGTYTGANVLKADGEYLVVNGTTPSVWTFSADDGGIDGGFTLNLTSTGPELLTDGGAAWPAPHGSITATLNPSGGATGTLTATATF